MDCVVIMDAVHEGFGAWCCAEQRAGAVQAVPGNASAARRTVRRTGGGRAQSAIAGSLRALPSGPGRHSKARVPAFWAAAARWTGHPTGPGAVGAALLRRLCRRHQWGRQAGARIRTAFGRPFSEACLVTRWSRDRVRAAPHPRMIASSRCAPCARTVAACAAALPAVVWLVRRPRRPPQLTSSVRLEASRL